MLYNDAEHDVLSHPVSLYVMLAFLTCFGGTIVYDCLRRCQSRERGQPFEVYMIVFLDLEVSVLSGYEVFEILTVDSNFAPILIMPAQ